MRLVGLVLNTSKISFNRQPSMNNVYVNLLSNFKLYVAFFTLNSPQKAQNKFLFHNKAKKFVPLQVLKAITLSLLQKQENVHFTST